MKRILAILAALLVFTTILGCEELFELDAPASKTKRPKTTVSKKVKKPKPKEFVPVIERPQQELEMIARAYESTRSTAMHIGSAEDQAVKKVSAAIAASVDLGPTLVIWIVDRTPSAQTLVSQTTAAAKGYYDSTEVQEWLMNPEQPLLSAVVAFDDKVEFLVEPSADGRQVQQGFDSLQPSTGGKELTFTAIKEALGKYLHYRTEDRREVLVVVITDEVGSDPEVVDELVETTRKNALPVYFIGTPAPWGQASPFAANPKAVDKNSTDDSVPVYGPETIDSERVDIQSSFGGRGGGYGAMANVEAIDSGFGPYHQERLCRASRGEFLAIRQERGESTFDYSRGTSSQYWPPGNEMRFDEEVVAKYAPEYLSEAEYRQQLAANKAWHGLVEAAKLPKLVVSDSPSTSFPKTNEAQMAQQISRAQQFAAKNSPPIDRYYDVLSPGEGDRDKLKTARLQAEFDLTMGRVLALKARVDGYNSMLAALKRGKTFQNEGSSRWSLEPADAYETESTLRKMAERAKTYLQRVIDEHPGTPWAKMAEEELQAPLGWTWKES